jgi:hypothetical protein
MQPTSISPGQKPAASMARATLTLGVLLFAPVLLIFPLAILGETFGWIAGITLGWLAGLVLVWSSTYWTAREKSLATLVWPGGLAPALLLAIFSGQVCEQTAGSAEICTGSWLPVWLGIPTLVVSVAGPLMVAVFLLIRVSSRQETARPDPPR